MDFRLRIFWRFSSVSIHVIAFLIYGLALVFQFIYPWGYRWKEVDDNLATDNSTDKPIAGEYSFGWKYKYLTYWNLNFQFFGYLLFLICDCLPANYLHHESIQNDCTKKLFRVRDLIFHSVLFPIGMFVCLTFWILFVIQKDLVIDPKLDERNPWWLTHTTHTIVGPLLILEALVTFHRRSKKTIEMSIMLMIAIAYLVWILYLGNFHDIWVYGIMKRLNSIKIGLFIVGCLAFMTLIYFIGLLIHKSLWTERRVELYGKTPNRISDEEELVEIINVSNRDQTIY